MKQHALALTVLSTLVGSTLVITAQATGPEGIEGPEVLTTLGEFVGQYVSGDWALYTGYAAFFVAGLGMLAYWFTKESF